MPLVEHFFLLVGFFCADHTLKLIIHLHQDLVGPRFLFQAASLPVFEAHVLKVVVKVGLYTLLLVEALQADG